MTVLLDGQTKQALPHIWHTTGKTECKFYGQVFCNRAFIQVNKGGVCTVYTSIFITRK